MSIAATVESLIPFENRKALESLAACVGERLVGFGAHRDTLVLRMGEGTRVRLWVLELEETLAELVDAASRHGSFAGAELTSVNEESGTIILTGSHRVTVKVVLQSAGTDPR